MSKIKHKGVQGARVKFEPFKEGLLLVSNENIIQVGKIVGAGKTSKYKCNIGSIFYVEDWRITKVMLDNDKIAYYAPDEAVIEVL